MAYSVLRPNRKLYNALCRELEQMQYELEKATDPKERERLLEEMHETERAIFQTGVTSEYDA